jgi:hypothetical protein
VKVYGEQIRDEQISAALAAMVGEFRCSDIENALVRAGVREPGAVAMRAADRLLQRERKAGRIRAVNNRLWERIA